MKNLRKSSLTLLIALTLIVSIFVTSNGVVAMSLPLYGKHESPNTFSKMTDEQLDGYFSFAEKAVETYYLTRMVSKKTTQALDTLPTTSVVKKYLESKLVFETSHAREFEYTENYISGEYSMLDWKIIDDSLYLKVFVMVAFKYSTSDEFSGFGRVVQIIIENPNDPIITDWYVDESYFDMNVRGYDLDLSKQENWLSNQAVSKIETRKVACLNFLDESIAFTKQQEEKAKRGELDLGFEIEQPYKQAPNEEYIPTRLSSTARNNMRTYAKTNYNKAKPASGGKGGNSSNVKYYDTYVNGCTEFISHCFLAGGFKTVGNNDTALCWFQKNNSPPGNGTRSSSWAGVEALYQFLKNKNRGSNDGGPRLNSNYSSNNTNVPYTSGDQDIIQIKYNFTGGYNYPNYGHSVIITGEQSLQTFVKRPKITWRTTSTKFDINIYLDSRYPPAKNTTSGSGGHLYRMIALQ